MALSMSHPKLKAVTLGCKVNQYETEFVRQGLLAVGYQDAGNNETADLCIVNTCTVTAEGDSKSRQLVRRLARQNPDSRIIVMGCYATRAPEELARLQGVSEVVTDKRELPDLLQRCGVADVPTGIAGFGNRQRAYVKVQDGCLLRCSFCIIPMVRPDMYSRPQAEIVDEVRRLLDAGHRAGRVAFFGRSGPEQAGEFQRGLQGAAELPHHPVDEPADLLDRGSVFRSAG